MEKFTYIPVGVCAKSFEITVDGTKVIAFTSVGGCPGNLIGISQAIEGMEYTDIVKKFENILCASKNTSCPMQIATALKQHFQK